MGDAQREAADRLLALMAAEAEKTRRRQALQSLADTAAELAARRRRREMHTIEGGEDG